MPTETLIESYSENYQDNNGVMQTLWNGAASAMGNAFTSPLTFKLTKCKFYMKKTGSPVGNATIELYAVTGAVGTTAVPTRSVLATSGTFDISTLTTSYALITFTFTGANRYKLRKNAGYAIFFKNPASGTIDGSNHPIMGRDITDPVYSGNHVYWNGAAWAAYAYPCPFYVYGYVIPAQQMIFLQ